MVEFVNKGCRVPDVGPSPHLLDDDQKLHSEPRISTAFTDEVRDRFYLKESDYRVDTACRRALINT